MASPMLTPAEQAIFAQHSTPQPQRGHCYQHPSILLAASSNTLAHLLVSIDPLAYLYFLQSSLILPRRLNPSQHTNSGTDPSGQSVEYSPLPPVLRQEHTIERRCDHGQCHCAHALQWVLLRLPCPLRAWKPQCTGKQVPLRLESGTPL